MRNIHKAAIAVLAIALAGCVHGNVEKPIEKFATGIHVTTASVGSAIESTDAVYRQQQYGRQIVNLLGNRSFSLSTEPLLPAKDIEARFAALEALNLYAIRLAELASSETTDQLDASVKNLADSLKSFDGAGFKVPDTVRSAGTAGIHAIADLILDRKRFSAIREQTAHMDRHVKAIASLLVEDLDSLQVRIGQLAADIESDQSTNLSRMRESKIPAHDLIQQYRAAAAQIEQAKGSASPIPAAIQSVKAMAAAHTALAKAASLDEPSFRVALEEFVKRAERTRATYRYAQS